MMPILASTYHLILGICTVNEYVHVGWCRNSLNMHMTFKLPIFMHIKSSHHPLQMFISLCVSKVFVYTPTFTWITRVCSVTCYFDRHQTLNLIITFSVCTLVLLDLLIKKTLCILSSLSIESLMMTSRYSSRGSLQVYKLCLCICSSFLIFQIY